MNDRLQLTAYIANLGALVLIFIAALVAACLHPEIMGRMEVFGLGTVLGGLIGNLRSPSSQRSGASVGTADSVNVTTQQAAAPDPNGSMAEPGK